MGNKLIRYLDIDDLENEVRADYFSRIIADDTSGYESVMLEAIAELKAAREVAFAARVYMEDKHKGSKDMEDALKNLDVVLNSKKYRKYVPEYEEDVRKLASGIFGYGNKK